MISFKERLDKIIDRVTSDELLSNTGLGNEIGFGLSSMRGAIICPN